MGAGGRRFKSSRPDQYFPGTSANTSQAAATASGFSAASAASANETPTTANLAGRVFPALALLRRDSEKRDGILLNVLAADGSQNRPLPMAVFVGYTGLRRVYGFADKKSGPHGGGLWPISSSVWPDCATSSALTYSTRKTKLLAGKTKDLAYVLLLQSGKNPTEAVNISFGKRADAFLSTQTTTFSLCKPFPASPLETADRRRDAGI